MSGTGGYYKYRCKYWLTHNCPNWVWVNNAPCANCLAEGRDSEMMMASSFRKSRDIFIPQLENGFLNYLPSEVIATSDDDIGWAVGVVPTQMFEAAVKVSIMRNIAAMDVNNTQ